MSAFSILNYFAWAASALIFFWLFKDFLKTNKEYDEDFLLGKNPEADTEFSAEQGGDDL